MIFTIAGKHIEVTEAIRNHAREKTSRLPKYYDSVNQVDVILDGSQANSPTVEVIARAEHSKVFIVRERGADVCSCIDVAVRKLEGQLRRAKGKERDNKYAAGPELTQ